MMSASSSSQARPTPTDGGVSRVDRQQQFNGGESPPTANGATADAAAGPSAAKTNTSTTTDETCVVANNDDASKAPGTFHATLPSSTGNVTAPPAKSSAARTDPSPSASSEEEEEWHSASSRLQRTPYSDHGSPSSSSSSSFYATPGTTGTDGTTTKAIDQTDASAGSSSTSSSDKISDARKTLQWTPPPSADSKWARLGVPIDDSKDGSTATNTGTAKGRSRSSSFDAGSGSAQHHPSSKKTKTSKGASPGSSLGPSLSSSMRIPRKNKKVPKKKVLLGNLQRFLDRALASPRDMYGSPDDLNVVEEKGGIIGMSSTAAADTTTTTKTNDAEVADVTESTKADEVKEESGDDAGTTSGIESFMPRQVVLKDAAQKAPSDAERNAAGSGVGTTTSPIIPTPMPPTHRSTSTSTPRNAGNPLEPRMNGRRDTMYVPGGGALLQQDDADHGSGVASNNGDVGSSPANLLTLPDSHTKDATFPPSCPVLVYGHAVASVLTGRVASVCIDISPGSDRAFLYCVKPDLAIPGVPSKITVAESKLRFAPDCPVVVTLNGSSSNGIVRSMIELDEGSGHFTMYTVHLLHLNGSPGSTLRHGVTPQELKFRPNSNVEVMGVLTDPSNRVLSSSKKDECANAMIKPFGQDETKYSSGEKGEIADDTENRTATKTSEYDVYKQPQDGLSKSTNKTNKFEEDGSILGGSTRSQRSSGSFSFDIKTSSNTNDVAIAIGVVNGLDLGKVREKLYGADKSTNEKMEKALEVKVTIVGRDFDYPDPSVQCEDDWDFVDGPYVLVRGTRKCIRKAVKVVSHILCDTAFDGADKDRLKKDIAAATVQCAIASGESTTIHGDYADRHYTRTSGEASFYSSMHENAEFPSQLNGSNYDYTYRINFPSWMNSSLVLGRIVGKKGQHVKKLCERFHCSIDTFGASTARPREHPDDEDELSYLVCIISGPNRDQIDECRLYIESIAMRSTEPEWRGRFAYDLAVSTEVGYSDHYCYYNSPRDGSIVVPAVWPGGESQKYMTCIDITPGVVEAPEETIGDLEELGHHYYCVIHLWGSVEEPHLHIVADSYGDAQAVANEIYRRLTGTSRNNGTEEGITE